MGNTLAHARAACPGAAEVSPAILVLTLSSVFMKLMYASYGESYGEKYLWTSPSAQYFVHM